jgi:FkbM family methyltransferase
MNFSNTLDNRTIVRCLYKTLLDREPDQQGFEFHLSLLNSGQADPYQVALGILHCPEFLEKQNNLGKEIVSLSDMRVYAGYSPEDLEVFAAFSGVNPQPKPGFVTDFIGSRTRISSLWDGCEHLDGVVVPPPIPFDYHAETVEWIGMLKAVLAAKDSFSAMELGAGYGPWIAASAAAARFRGIGQLSLSAIEADPGRFTMLQQNVADNDLAQNDVTLIQAAVGVSDGHARWPKLGDPRNNCGARPLREGNCSDELYLGSLSQETVGVEIVALGRLLESRMIWDFVHMDVQGTEAELCAGALSALTSRVRYLVIGTHSRKLDGDVMEILLDGGWHLEHEKPARMAFSAGTKSLTAMVKVDGTQVWRNPRL